jgi:hypothetical protein
MIVYIHNAILTQLGDIPAKCNRLRKVLRLVRIKLQKHRLSASANKQLQVKEAF